MKKTLRILSNKYLLVSLVALTWITFFDRYKLVSRYSDWSELQELKEKEEYYKQEIVKVKKSRNELLNNPETLEKFARERYYMSRDGEDIFIVEKK
ncbi:MAG: septum formation initiator family protein [Bacteroidota bacterium]|nr:septum formation initiator family protein [Bacteroidota bacterium]